MAGDTTLTIEEVDAAERVLARVEVGDCWTVPGKPEHYARVKVGGRLCHAHRVVYEVLVGPIPDGLELDHLCRVHRCVNPDHCEPVTHAVNIGRGNPGRAATRCKAGHAFTPDNTRIDKNGAQRCRACHRRWTQEWRSRRGR